MASGSFFARTFFALENREFRILWFGTLFSFLGMQMQVIARGFLAYDLTGKNSALGGVMLAFGVPQLLLSLWGGVIADRLPKRKVLWIGQFFVASNSAWIATMIALGQIEYWMLLVAGVVQGAGFAFIGPARQAFIGDLVERDAMGNAIVLQQLSMNSTRVVGPSLAGLMIAIPFVGTAGVYYVTTAGFIVAMVSMIWLPAGDPRPGKESRSAIHDLREGLRYIKHRPAILQLILTSFAIVMIGFPYQSFLPSIAKDVYGVGAGGLGLLSSAAAVGAVVATILVAAYAGHPRAWSWHGVLALAFAIALIGLGIAPTFGFGLLAMVGVGATASAFQSLNSSLTITSTDQQFHGRVQSTSMLSWSLFGLVALPLGILADTIGIRETLVIMGCLCIVALAALEVFGRARHVERDRFSGMPREVTIAGGGQ